MTTEKQLEFDIPRYRKKALLAALIIPEIPRPSGGKSKNASSLKHLLKTIEDRHGKGGMPRLKQSTLAAEMGLKSVNSGADYLANALMITLKVW